MATRVGIGLGVRETFIGNPRVLREAVNRRMPDGGFLAAWDIVPGPAADQHLARLVNGHDPTDHRRTVTTAWLRRETTLDWLLTAFERDHNAAWADDLARAYDILRWQALAEPG